MLLLSLRDAESGTPPSVYRRDRLERQPGAAHPLRTQTNFMWILPKQLISAFAQDTEALTSDSVELSQTCAQSLMRRSKPSPAKTYLREWKAGSLMRLRYGAISSHFLGQSFLGWWISCLVATRVSPSAAQASEPEQTTQDTSGHLSQVAFKFYDPDCASSRTWKDTLASDSEKSLQTWKALVTKRRGEYSQRLNAARLTSEKECSSWPTASTRDHKGGYEGGRIRDGKVSMDTLDVAVQAYSLGGLLDLASPNTHGSRPEWWGTPAANDSNKTPHCEINSKQAGLVRSVGREQAKAWLTPRANEPEADSNFVARNADRGEHCHVSLTSQAKAWATPEGMAGGKISRGGKRKNELLLTGQVKAWPTPASSTGSGGPHGLDGGAGARSMLPEDMQRSSGKLNPRWVETLMGLPVGWTMPSCQSPATIAQTSCASLATESSQQRQP